MVGGRREDVDDRAAHRDLAAVLDLVLAAVAGGDEPRDELVAVDLVARPHDDRLDVLDVRAEPLHQRPHRRDDDRRRAVAGVAQPPQHAQAAAHRLDDGRHPLERQRLPRREQLDLAPAPRNWPRSRARRSASAPVGTATSSGRRVVTPASDATNSGRAASGTATAAVAADHRAQRRLVGEERGEGGEGQVRTVTRVDEARDERTPGADGRTRRVGRSAVIGAVS